MKFFKAIVRNIKNFFVLKRHKFTPLRINKHLIIQNGLFKDDYDERDLIKPKVKLSKDDLQLNITQTSLKTYAPKCSEFNQAATSACGGFAASAFMHILMNKMQHLSKSSVESPYFSPLWVYWNARLNDGFGSEKIDEGTTLRSVMKSLKSPGVIDEKEWKFGWHFPTEEPSKKAKSANKITLQDYLRIPMKEESMQIVKDVLSIEQIPILVGLTLYREQQAEAYKTGFLKPVANKNNISCIGGHAVCVTGYKEIDGQVWLEFINSWGQDWGDYGYGYFPIEWIYDSFYVIDIWTCSKKYF